MAGLSMAAEVSFTRNLVMLASSTLGTTSKPA
jgi:hypothetical protein